MIASLSREKLLFYVYLPQKVYFYRYVFIIKQQTPAFSGRGAVCMRLPQWVQGFFAPGYADDRLGADQAAVIVGLVGEGGNMGRCHHIF